MQMYRDAVSDDDDEWCFNRKLPFFGGIQSLNGLLKCWNYMKPNTVYQSTL